MCFFEAHPNFVSGKNNCHLAIENSFFFWHLWASDSLSDQIFLYSALNLFFVGDLTFWRTLAFYASELMCTNYALKPHLYSHWHCILSIIAMRFRTNNLSNIIVLSFIYSTQHFIKIWLSCIIRPISAKTTLPPPDINFLKRIFILLLNVTMKEKKTMNTQFTHTKNRKIKMRWFPKVGFK